MKAGNRNLLGVGLSFISALAAAVAMTLVIVNDRSAPRNDQALTSELAANVLNLERALGYGGLIHNFKNYLLRPNETLYRDVARENVDQILIGLSGLSDLVRQLDLDGGFAAMEEVVQLYGAAIDNVENLHNAGLSPQKIDSMVRIDDRNAFQEIETAAAAAQSVLAQRAAEQSRRNSTYLIAINLLLAAFAISIASAFIVLFADRRRRGRELIAANNYADDLEDMARIATHDIRSPLKQIAFLVEEVLNNSLRNDGHLSEEGLEDLALIKQRTLRVDAMVEETLGLMRTSTLVGEREVVDLRDLVRSIVEIDAPPTLPITIEGGDKVRVDKAKLTIVLRNLISNAVKHGKTSDPHLKIRMVESRKSVEISVEDNGPGIAEEHRDRIFTLFATLGDGGEGEKVDGVGLAMVRKIVRRLGGDVSVAESALGGAAFCVTLPK
nr:HAMP domain-containing sensor histidine kinase [Amylibacter sp.]